MWKTPPTKVPPPGDRAALPRAAAAGELAGVGQRLREAHAHRGADGGGEAREEGDVRVLGGERHGEDRRERGERAVDQPDQRGLDAREQEGVLLLGEALARGRSGFHSLRVSRRASARGVRLASWQRKSQSQTAASGRSSATRSGSWGSASSRSGSTTSSGGTTSTARCATSATPAGSDLGQNPGNSVLAVTLGALIIVPAIVSMWRTSDRIQRTQEVGGRRSRSERPDHLHPAAADRPGGPLVRAERAEQGVDHAGRRRAARACRRPSRARRPRRLRPRRSRRVRARGA